MRANYAFKHLNDRELLENLSRCAGEERRSTAELVALIAEVDERRLYVPAGYPSMFAYCVEVLRLSEDAAYKRIRAARAARENPEIFEQLADGRLSLTAVTLLSPHLKGNAELLQAATHMGKTQVQQLLAERFPSADVPTRLTPLRTQAPSVELVPEPVVAPARAAIPAAAPPRPATVRPLAPQRFTLQVTVTQKFKDLLKAAQELLSHAGNNNVADVLERGLERLVKELREKKCGDVEKPRAPRPIAPGSRTIPAHVRRAVWKRDGGQCTYVSEGGHRCEGRKLLEYDHAQPFALGGLPVVDKIRLRCRAHNYYAAEQAFGAGFMKAKREAREMSGVPC